MVAKIFWKCYALYEKVFNYAPGATGPKLMMLWRYRKSLKWGEYLSVLQVSFWSELVE